MELSCPLGTSRRVPQEKFPRRPHNKSFIDQVCSFKMAGYWPRSFFGELMDRDGVEVHKQKRTWPISSHLDLTLAVTLFKNPYILTCRLQGIQDKLLWRCFLYPRDKGSLKNCNFFPESLGPMLEYSYISNMAYSSEMSGTFIKAC